MKNYGFLFWAYAVIWIGIAAYVAFLGVRLRKVADRLDRLEGAARDEARR
jgi:CcmD family protein